MVNTSLGIKGVTEIGFVKQRCGYKHIEFLRLLSFLRLIVEIICTVFSFFFLFFVQWSICHKLMWQREKLIIHLGNLNKQTIFINRIDYTTFLINSISNQEKKPILINWLKFIACRKAVIQITMIKKYEHDLYFVVLGNIRNLSIEEVPTVF